MSYAAQRFPRTRDFATIKSRMDVAKRRASISAAVVAGFIANASDASASGSILVVVPRAALASAIGFNPLAKVDLDNEHP